MKQGKSNWKKIMFDKKLIVWFNPMNGFPLAVLKEVASLKLKNKEILKNTLKKIFILRLNFLLAPIFLPSGLKCPDFTC